ncbi:MAG TPA: tetratricopeptide repeat protein, partial [Chloroflexota bacterium]|nr:tetratricopeptide repeat protein [Chloroflexota bacterium]
RLDDRFRLLTGGSRMAPARQQSLRATVEWSYGLLPPAERRLFERLAVFSGGWSLDAAEAVGAGGALAAGEILDLLGQLVDKSLVVADVLDEGDAERAAAEAPAAAPGGGADDGEEKGGGGKAEPRYRMLETIREYARDRLAAGGEGAGVRARHAAFCLALAERADRESHGPAHGAWLRRLDAEQDNLRLALEWAAEQEEAELGLRLGAALGWFWQARGYASEGRARLARLLALPGVAERVRPGVRAAALRAAAKVAWVQGDYAAHRRLYEESLALFRQAGDEAGIASALTSLGGAAWTRGDHAAARALYEQSLRTWQAVQRRAQQAAPPPGGGGDPLTVRTRHAIAELRAMMANLARDGGDFAAARALYEQSLRAARSAGDRSIYAHALSNLGIMAHYEGDFAAARALQEESLAIRRELGEQREIAVSLTRIGQAAVDLGEPAAARRALHESLRLHQVVGNLAGLALVLEGAAALAAAGPAAPAAAPAAAAQALRLAGAAAAVRDAIGRPLPPAERPVIERWLAPARRALSAAAQEAAWDEGRAMPREQALEEALAVEAVEAVEAVPPAATEAAGAEAAPGGEQAAPLTRREREVAVLVARGLTNRQIAAELVISERTAAHHVDHILTKLGARSRAQIAAWAMAQGRQDPR